MANDRTLSPTELADLIGRVRRFIDERIIPLEPRLGTDDAASEALLASLKDQAKAEGLWALGHPVEIGGQGLPFAQYALVNEVIGRSQFAMPALGTNNLQDALMLLKFGTPEQKQLYLDPLVQGKIRSSKGLTEPDTAGSDPTLYQSSARLDGDEWVINAHKWFTTNADRAAFTTMFVRTEGPDTPRHKAISAIIVPTDTPGYKVKRVLKTFGHSHGHHPEIELTDVRVPYANLLGERGRGFHILQVLLTAGRIFHCMRWLGQAQRAFELMCERANERYVHGSLLADKGEIQAYVAHSAAQIQAARLLTLEAARVYDSGGDARVAVSLAKFYGADMLNYVVDKAIQVQGARGVTEDTPLHDMFLEARYARFYDGPDEVHRMNVAKALLGDPARAPWIDPAG